MFARLLQKLTQMWDRLKTKIKVQLIKMKSDLTFELLSKHSLSVFIRLYHEPHREKNTHTHPTIQLYINLHPNEIESIFFLQKKSN